MLDGWPNPVDPVTALRAALERTVAVIAIASGLAASGRIIDLSGLDAMTGEVCAKVLDLPPYDGLALRSDLETLSERLAALHQSLCHFTP